jgi:hypothetical protein
MNLATLPTIPMTPHPQTEAVFAAVLKALQWARAELTQTGHREVSCRMQDVGGYALFVSARDTDGDVWASWSVMNTARNTKCSLLEDLISPNVVEVSAALFSVDSHEVPA